VTATEDSPQLGITTGDLEKLLERIQLLGNDGDRRKLGEAGTQKWDDDTPLSFQVIKSGATQVTQTWTKLARNVGGAAALLSVIGGGVAGLIGELSVPVATALVAGCAVFLAAIAVSIAVIVSADLRARSVATAARTEGRATVTTGFLHAQPSDAPSGNGSFDDGEISLLLAVATKRPVTVTTTEHPDRPAKVTGVKRTAQGLRFMTRGDVLSISEIASWSTG
jgi:hypothetical protein